MNSRIRMICKVLEMCQRKGWKWKVGLTKNQNKWLKYDDYWNEYFKEIREEHGKER